MSRKVYLKVKSKVMVPVIVTTTVIATVDEDVHMEHIADVAINNASNPNDITIEDIYSDSFTVEKCNEDDSLEDQMVDFVTDEEIVSHEILSVDVEDSK